ncbi:hypothetical protein MNBD_GAMMA12-1213 [hydrothermal vent metagenome]|uniref:Peptidase S8/S53 domain-containing protein n=1 Tax=hydrothermal vent metagenome TaxID=652676 RepID=A0A3B0YF48_9ZZZZ
MKNYKIKCSLPVLVTFFTGALLASITGSSLAGSANHKTLYLQNKAKLKLNTNTQITIANANAMFAANRDIQGRKIYKDTELIVRFKPTISQSALTLTVNQYGSISGKKLSFSNNKQFNVVKIKSGESIHQVYARYKSDPNVISVTYNYLFYALALPTDPRFGQQWGLRNTGQSVNGVSGASGADMGLQLAWDVQTNCSSVVVAVLDTGINYTHLDLADSIPAAMQALMRDFTGADPTVPGVSAYPQAGHESHGTHVAGIIGSRANNGLGTAGVCWQSSIMPLRVLNEDGAGSTSSIAEGIKYASANGAKVINMSLGVKIGPQFTVADVEILSVAMDDARTAGVVVVIAAGNDNTDNDLTPVYPCNLPHDNIICVAAMDQNRALAEFSNDGKTSVDVVAPGTNVLSTLPGISLTVANANTGWTGSNVAGPWAEGVCSFVEFGVLNANFLLNPSTFCADIPGTYSNTANDVIYKGFNLSVFSGAQQVSAVGLLSLDLEVDTSVSPIVFDEFTIMASPGTANPFIAATGAATTYFGSTNGSLFEGTFAVASDCYIATCTIGFRLRSILTATTVTGAGVGISLLNFVSLSNAPGVGAYEYFQGTSMATPHVAGLAALLLAKNPNFTYLDTINAIKNGGTLVPAFNKTTSGRAVSAIGAMRYTAAPTGITVSVAAP